VGIPTSSHSQITFDQLPSFEKKRSRPNATLWLDAESCAALLVISGAMLFENLRFDVGSYLLHEIRG
jgi:hypothetical protein